MPALVCRVCQTPVVDAEGCVSWLHQPATPTPRRVGEWLHLACRPALRQTLSPAECVATSFLHLLDLPTGLLGAWIVEPNLIAYAPTAALSVRYCPQDPPRTQHRRVWALTLAEATLEGAYIHLNRSQEIVFRVPEFMEFSEIRLASASGQVLHFNRDLYDINVHYYGHNRSENSLTHPLDWA